MTAINVSLRIEYGMNGISCGQTAGWRSSCQRCHEHPPSLRARIKG